MDASQNKGHRSQRHKMRQGEIESENELKEEAEE